MTIMEFIAKFKEIKERGFVPSMRTGPTGVMKGTSPELLADQFREENILIDLRLHDKGTQARNHGTGIRAYEDKLPSLFQNIRDL